MTYTFFSEADRAKPPLNESESKFLSYLATFIGPVIRVA